MKLNNSIFLFLCVFATTLLMTSCEKDPVVDPPATGGFILTETTIDGAAYTKVEGSATENYTFTADKNWLLSGGIFVNDGATLTIEAGTNVYAADDGTTPFLAIKQGGQINAVGTATSPIVFTSIKSVSGNASAGDWGGIIVNGYATINVGATAEGEGGTGTYGGTDDTDNSGTIKYVRVEYAGKLLSTDNELNGFSFNGVGSGTTVEYIEAYKGADDGIEFFGGTVSVKYALSVGNNDDSFDWTHGWRGKGQFWVAKQLTTGGDRGIEADNNGDDNSLTPISYPTLSNITLVGADDGDGNNQGMKLREGTKARIHNAIVTGFPKRGVQVEHDFTIANVESGELVLANSIVENASPYVYTTSAGASVIPASGEFGNDQTNAITGSMLTDFVGVTTADSADPTGLDTWFSAATYIGAVDAANDWTTGWTVLQ